jgi:hypothetical protein
MRAHQPGSTPIDIPETVPNPAHTPAPTPAPERAPTKVPDKVPEKVIAPASFDAFFWDQARDMAPDRSAVPECEHHPDPDIDGRQHEPRRGADVSGQGNRTAKSERTCTAITRHAQRQCREPSSGRRMTVSLQPVH